MDPLSLTTAVVTLLGVCVSTTRTCAKLRRLKNAPSLIQALNDEVSDLCRIVVDASDFFERLSSSTDSAAHTNQAFLELCSSSLSRATILVDEVKKVLEGGLVKVEKQNKIKMSWNFLRKHTKLARLRGELQGVRLQLATLFSQIAARKTSRIETLLASVHEDGLPFLAEGQMRIERKLDHILSMQVSQPKSDSYISQRANDLCVPNVIVSSGPSPSRSIYSTCSCPKYLSKVALNTLFGKLFLGYGVRWTTESHRNNCSSEAKLNITMFFMFPLWLTRYAILFEAALGGRDVLTYSLNVTQLLALDHPDHYLMRQGDIAGVAKLLVSGCVSIKAQHLTGRASLLSASRTPHSLMR